MSVFFKKTSALDKRIKRVRKELSVVNSEIEALSRPGARPRKRVDSDRMRARQVAERRRSEGLAPLPKSPPPAAKPASPPVAAGKEPNPQRPSAHDQRFADYLSGSFEAMRPLRHERHVQRNKAVVMILIVLVALFWAIYKFVFL